ncbi:Ferric enterobactin transport protein FepE [compost metagenome]
MRSENERLRSDEIDLFDLIEVFWQDRIIVVAVGFFFTIVAAVYAFVSTPVYESKVIVQPPSQNDIAQLNYGRGGDTGLAMITVKDAYDIYVRNLQSESLRREFFRKVYLPSLSEAERKGSQDELYGSFQQVLSIGSASKDNTGRYFVKARLSDPERAAEWVVQYIEMAGVRSSTETIKDAKADATVKANNLEQQITAARESARKQREDRIVQLTEALKIAHATGIKEPPIISSNLSDEVSAGMGGSLTYMRGSKALEAEIANLQNRTSDDPFVNDLRQRQEALSFYRHLQVDPGVVQVYRQDGAVESPDKPVKPHKPVIIALGLAGGVAFGMLVAFARYYRRGRILKASHIQ